MIEELLGVIGRPWLVAAAAVAAVAGTKTGRRMTRTVVKSAVHTGATVGDGLKNLTARVQEEFSDVVAEAKAEISQKHTAEKAETKRTKKGS